LAEAPEKYRRMRMLVAAGGTGGHLYPAIAVAERFRDLAQGAEVIFVGTERGLESSIVPAAGFPLELVRAAPLRGGSLLRKLRGVEGLFLGLFDSVRLLKRLDPQVVMGVGAYVSGTLLLSAALEGIPTLILEPNAEPGLANRWLGPFVDEAACAWEETTRYFGRKGFVTGNPVRREIAEVAPLGPQSSQRMRVLVFGGSQGSSALNRAVRGSLTILSSELHRLEWVHQTGPRDLPSVSEAYARHSLRAQVVPYIDRMHEAYEAADLVIARAGATTCAELACAGRGALLLPLPLAGGHQEKNAEMMARAGAARVVREIELTPERLARETLALLNAPEERARMADSARTLARPDAAENVARRLLRLAGGEVAT
jgi:UDP-N-acetylglucosamine--N-acetylmuramyl-(pentapeptide) pyrophosphoryl-undecaprenol N-acetylglucosamine transferase